MEPLQSFGLGDTRYERVNDHWVCGRAADGTPCPIGPGGSGHCQVHLACQPYRDGDRYVCPEHPTGKLVSLERRVWSKGCPGPLPDGRCPMTGPPCQPAPSLRTRRRRWTFLAAAAAFAISLILLSGPGAQMLTSPGELTSQHHSSHQDCSSCHAAADGNLIATIRSAITSPGESAISDSQRCQKCHELGDSPQFARFPHSRDPASMSDITERLLRKVDQSQPAMFSAAGLGIALPNHDGEMACSTCHHEHRGKDFDLTQMTDRQCQTCHVGPFHSFAEGHPEFHDYPYQRRSMIHFDHSSHYGVHFADFARIMPDGRMPQDCLTCHEPDSTTTTMPIRGFAESCASCHGPQMENHRFPGITVFALPKLDPEALQTAGREIGEWPTGSAPGIDALPPLMELLLADDDQYRPALMALRGIDLRDLNDVGIEPDAAQRRTEAVERLAWVIKSLLHDLLRDGPSGLEQRLAHALEERAEGSELRTLAGRAAAGPSLWQTLSAAQAAWFPNLTDEIRRYRQGQRPETKVIDVTDTQEPRTPNGGWQLSRGALSVEYHGTGHSDPWFRAWLDVTVRFPQLDANAIHDPAIEVQDDRRFPALQRFYDKLADPTSVHRCLDCHSVDSTPSGLRINWHGRQADPADHPIVKFSHSPHVQLNRCTDCHRLDNDVTFQHPQFWKVDGTPRISTDGESPCTSGFEKVTRGLCAECHNAQRVGDSCLKCHNYHTGRFRTIPQ